MPGVRDGVSALRIRVSRPDWRAEPVLVNRVIVFTFTFLAASRVALVRSVYVDEHLTLGPDCCHGHRVANNRFDIALLIWTRVLKV